MTPLPRLLEGQVVHLRLRPAAHAFTYPVFYVQIPLRHLASAECGIFSVERPNLLGFRNADHGPRDGSPLLPWIEDLLRQHALPTGGEIILQCFPRVLGHVFDPVSFWFCHDRGGALVAVLAEVNNTFGGTHSYLLHRDGRPLHDGETLEAGKAFHVSPFNRIEGGYRFRFHLGRDRQMARIDYADAEGDLMHTAISGRARAWQARSLLGAFLRMPLLTFGIVARIHWQAFRLWIKRVPFHGVDPAKTLIQESRQ